MPDPYLCYVAGPWAWFTTAPLGKQWGDDWNDAPYEHNAGDPYGWAPHRNMEPYRLTKVAWDGPFDTPADLGGINSRWSVAAINAGLIAWLQTSAWNPEPRVVIPAGTSLSDFKRLVCAAGGRVYVEEACDA